MRILYVTNMFPDETHIYKGIHVKEQIEYLKEKHGIQYYIYHILGTKSRFNYLKSIFQINAILKRSNFDMVHVHFGLSGLFLLFNPFLKIPVILTIHGSDANPRKGRGMFLLISKLVSRFCNELILVNKDLKLNFTKHSKNISIIPCGVDLKEFLPQRKNNKNSFVVGFPGDPNRQEKNYPFFKEVMNELSDMDIKEVIFHNLTREEVADKLKALDCLLMTSTSEGSPQIVKEALASNVPVISSNVGDVSNTLKDVTNCFVIDGYNKLEYVRAVFELYKLPATERASNGREKIVDLAFDQDSVANSIYRLYQKLSKP